MFGTSNRAVIIADDAFIRIIRIVQANGCNTKKDEPQHDKTNKVGVRPAKTQISLGIRPVWSESSLSAWRKLGYLATHWAHSEDSDQTGRMPRLIWVFAGRTLALFVLSCRGSDESKHKINRTLSSYTANVLRICDSRASYLKLRIYLVLTHQ